MTDPGEGSGAGGGAVITGQKWKSVLAADL